MVLPNEHPTKSFWIEAAHSPLRNLRTTKDLPEKTDVLIVGAGYSGVTTAYWLTRYAATPPSIVLLDAGEICAGATGRNGGHLRPHYWRAYSAWENAFPGQGMNMIKHEIAHIPAFQQLLAEEPIDCSFRLIKTSHLDMTPESIRLSNEVYEDLVRREGLEAVKDVEIFEGEEAEKVSRVKGTLKAWRYPAAQVWPYKFIHGLLGKLVDRNQINVQTHTPATDLSGPDAEGYFTITTPRGIIKAKRVVHANNRWVDHLLPELSGLVKPIRGTVSAIKASPELVKNPWVTSAASIWDSVINNYFCQLPPPYNTFIVGGAKPLLAKHPDWWINNDDDEHLIEGAEEYFRSWPDDTVVAWDGGKVADLEQPGVWTGIMGDSPDGVPYVGPVPGKKGQFVSAVFNGHGMPRILLSSAHNVPLILESLGIKVTTPSIAKDFPPLPEPFKITSARLEKLRNTVQNLTRLNEHEDIAEVREVVEVEPIVYGGQSGVDQAMIPAIESIDTDNMTASATSSNKEDLQQQEQSGTNLSDWLKSCLMRPQKDKPSRMIIHQDGEEKEGVM